MMSMDQQIGRLTVNPGSGVTFKRALGHSGFAYIVSTSSKLLQFTERGQVVDPEPVTGTDSGFCPESRPEGSPESGPDSVPEDDPENDPEDDSEDEPEPAPEDSIEAG